MIGVGAVLLLIGVSTVRSGLGPTRRFGWQVEAAGVTALGVRWILASTGLA